MLFRVFLLAGLLGLLGSAGCDGCCDKCNFTGDADVDAPPMGTVSLAWSIVDLAGQPVSCDQVGAATVFLQFRDPRILSSPVESFSCQNSPSTSHPLDPGTYNITFELHGANLSAVTAPMQTSVVVAPGRDTALAPITFVVDAKGTLVLALAAPSPLTSNCKPTGMMGAGITGTTITLVHTGDGCAPVTFVRTRGATMLGSYIVNCTSPAVTTCIENDEQLTVSGIPSGPYTIHVRGKVGAVDCWVNDDSFQVPAQGKTLNQMLNLVSQTGTTGC
jgi:hypothetical protein